MSNNYDDLIERAQKAGIDIDEIVYSVNVADIVGEISSLFGDDTEKLTMDELLKLIEIGKGGAEEIEWSDPIFLILTESEIFKNLQGDN